MLTFHLFMAALVIGNSQLMGSHMVPQLVANPYYNSDAAPGTLPSMPACVAWQWE